MISFIIPSLLSGSRLIDCIDSILDQNVKVSQEIIIVDNHPVTPVLDSTICRKNQNIRLFHEPRPGAGVARNRGIREARGDILVFLDSDVTLAPDWLEEALRPLRFPWVSVVQTSVFPVGEGPMLSLRKRMIGAKTLGTFNYLNLATECWPQINTASLLVRRSVLTEDLRFSEELRRCEDTDFGLRLFFSGAHFATAVKAHSFVTDHRNFLAYLLRSYHSGFFLGKVRRNWNDPGHGLWVHRLPEIFRSAAGWDTVVFALAHLLGEIREDFSGGKENDFRQKYLRREKLNLLRFRPPLSPDIRIVLLEREIIFYDLHAQTRWVLRDQEKEDWIRNAAEAEL